MSGSPKYAQVRLDAARRQRLAEERARRVAERHRRAEERRRQALERQRTRIASRRAAQDRRREETIRKVAALAARVDGAVGLTEQQRATLRTRVAEAQRAAAGADAAVAAARVRGLEHALGVAEGRAADGSAAAQRAAAIESVGAALAAVEDRLRHDEPGARQVDRLLQAARQATIDARRFQRAHDTLLDRLDEHVAAVREAQVLAERAELEVGQAGAALDAVVEEAGAAGIDLVGWPDAVRLRERIEADLASDRAESALHGAERLAAAVTELEAQVEVVLDQLQAAELIMAAAVQALPAVGFRVVEDSVTQTGGNVAFEVARADGAVIELQIEPADGGARLSYAGTASDYVIEHGPDGAVARCDITEDLLERFHDELDQEGIETDDLQWEGKPLRPSRLGARAAGRTATGTLSQD